MRSIGSRTGLAAMTVLATTLALPAAGCARETLPPLATAIAPMPSPRVPSGVSFHATLDGPLSSLHAAVDDKITATLDEPLRSADGVNLVPAGAKLHGHILEVGREGINRLVLQFDTLEFGGHDRAIDAQVTRLDSTRVVASHGTDPSSVSVDVYPILPRSASQQEIGGGPPSAQLPIELDAGAGVQLYLSRPFVLDPPTSQAR